MIRDAVEKDDLAIRYGGDEFLILSHGTDAAVWEARREKINQELKKIAEQQQLPYKLGVSLGYAISTEDSPLSIEESLELADQAMYENKKQRKLRHS